jgi:AbrB family looped-hinge helix DNA binding protein
VGTTVKVRSKHSVTIPEAVRREVDLKIGDRVEVTAEDGRIVIRPMMEIPRDQAWYWTKAWQTREREADEDIAAGRVSGPFATAPGLLRSLKRRR